MIHELFPYLCVSDANSAIDYYSKVFGATEKFRLAEPGGKIGHAELEFGATTIMLCEEYPELNVISPERLEGTAMSIHLHVDNADEVINRALEAGATIETPVQDYFYGERGGVIRDPFGHRWNIGHSIEQVSPEQMQQRYTMSMEGTSAST